MQKSHKEMIKYSIEYERLLAVQIIMLAPMAPHFASALWSGFISAPGRINHNWEQISWENDVINQKWPEVDSDYNLNLYCMVCIYIIFLIFLLLRYTITFKLLFLKI